MLDPKTLENIQQTAIKAHGVRHFQVPAEPSHVYYVVDSDGNHELCRADPKPYDHVHTTIQSLCGWAHKNEATEIWIGVRSIVAVKDRSRATFQFTYSDPFNELREYAEREDATAEIPQAELYQKLRTTFRGCTPDHGNLAPLVGKVDIKKAQEASGAVTTGKVSMSRSMVAEASGAGQLPDVLIFKVPLFETAPLEADARINTAFDLEPQDEVFRIVILPGEIDAAMHKARTYLHSLIAKELEYLGVLIQVYFGEPSRP